MQASELIGIWKLESRAGRTPAQLGLKGILREFKNDGSYIEAGKRLSQFQGLLPESKWQDTGVWKLYDDVLEISNDEGSFQSKIAVAGDTLEMTYIYPEDTNKKIVVLHKRFNAPQPPI